MRPGSVRPNAGPRGGRTALTLARLAASVAGTGKPAGLQPGGSLLSIFVIAYQDARDACR